MRNDSPHDWTGEQYHCTTCGASMHCPHCNRGCGGQGHLVKDDDGYFFWCLEPERYERLRDKWFARR